MILYNLKPWHFIISLTVLYIFPTAVYNLYPGIDQTDVYWSTRALADSSASKLPPHAPTVAIFTACKGRHETLNTSLPTWLAQNVVEIVLLDWYSTPPLSRLLSTYDDLRIKGYTMVGEEKPWILSRAFNLAARLSKADWLLKVDCDTGLEKTFLDVHRPQKGTFVAGNWRKARNENEIHLNGVLFVSKSDFFGVGGYDERIVTYGWDDSDMVNRLREQLGLTERTFDFDHIYHIPHADALRTHFQTNSPPAVEIEKNRMMIEKVIPWTNSSKSSEYEMVGNNEITTTADCYEPPSLSDLILEMERIEKVKYLHSIGVPQSSIDSLGVSDLRSLVSLHTSQEKLLIIHGLNGLGNRLRALAAGISIARGLSRKLVLVWKRDPHCDVEFQYLFTNNIEMHNYLQHDQLSDDLFSKYDPETKLTNATVDISNPRGHLYLRTAYVLGSIHSTPEEDKKSLMTLQPHPDVLNMVNRYQVDNAIGVHIRQSDDEFIAPKVHEESVHRGVISEVKLWRKKSSLEVFRVKIAQLLESDLDARFFVASDTKENINTLITHFPGKIMYLEEACALRNATCVPTALAEMIILSRTKYLLGSAWSSFTETVKRFAEKPDFTTYVSSNNFTW